jgi:hypothetical protein
MKISIKNKKFDIFSLYFIPIILTFLLGIFFIVLANIKWAKKMYEIAGIIETYYSENGLKNLSPEELLELGIKEKVYITINKNGSYYIVNKNKNLVYRSEYNDLVEEDSDY